MWFRVIYYFSVTHAALRGKTSDWIAWNQENVSELNYISNCEHLVKGVGLGYGRQLYVQCLLKYMVICAFENPPQLQAS